VDSLNKCLNCIAQPRLYSLEQVVALVFGFTCFGVDVWAVFCTVRYFSGEYAIPGTGARRFGLASLFLEPLLAVAVLFLLAFAFSSRTKSDEQQ
jgi:hypothetical protein